MFQVHLLFEKRALGLYKLDLLEQSMILHLGLLQGVSDLPRSIAVYAKMPPQLGDVSGASVVF